MLRCAILGAQGLYALYRKAELALLALSSQPSALGSRLSALGSRLSAPSSQLPAPSSQLPAPSSQLPALGSRLSALNFPNNNSFKYESRYLDFFAFYLFSTFAFHSSIQSVVNELSCPVQRHLLV